jgi:hypothetical protein
MKEDSEATLSSGECAAVEFARNLIELRGGLSHKHSQDYWRFSTKAELRGQVDTGERFLQRIKNCFIKERGEVSIYFPPGIGNELCRQLLIPFPWPGSGGKITNTMTVGLSKIGEQRLSY